MEEPKTYIPDFYKIFTPVPYQVKRQESNLSEDEVINVMCEDCSLQHADIIVLNQTEEVKETPSQEND